MTQWKNKKIFFVGIILLVGLLISACTQAKMEDQNEKVIQKVLELQFSGPDEKLIDLMWNPKYKVVENGVEKNPEFEKYAKEVYGDYFTENELDIFMRTFGTSYQSLAHTNNYNLSFEGISIKKIEKNPNHYEFTAQVGYNKGDGQDGTTEAEGTI
ncbi:hypothetical protein RLJ60_04940, partial [Streptococcus pneumoniae]|nr:hypothetical protein [Streptococcus pneumoniae]